MDTTDEKQHDSHENADDEANAGHSRREFHLSVPAERAVFHGRLLIIGGPS
jgi:hypothetical protein